MLACHHGGRHALTCRLCGGQLSSQAHYYYDAQQANTRANKRSRHESYASPATASPELDLEGLQAVSTETKLNSMQNSPLGKQAAQRQALKARIAGLNGRPFTAEFLAAIGTESSQMSHTGTLGGYIAYHGGAGSKGEELVLALHPNMEPLACSNYEDAFLALNSFAAEKALVPIEDSLGGSVQAVLDLFLRYQVTIEQEAFAASQCCLAGRPGTKIDSIRRLLSDTTSLKECSNYLKVLHHVTRETAADGSLAAQAAVSDKSGCTVAIVSQKTAALFGLEVLESNIQDNKHGNMTRYVVLTRESVKLLKDSSQPHKTSIVFSFPEKPGTLFHCLSVFALRDINLTKIESRPFKDDPTIMDPDVGRKFQYRFHLDLAGTLASSSVQNAVVHLKEIAPFVKILGCYPRATTSPIPSPPIETGTASELQEHITANLPHHSSSVAPQDGSLDVDSLLISAAATMQPIQQERIGAAGLRVAYQGNPGAYSESAVLTAFPAGHPVPCEQFEDAFQALSQFLVDRAVLPIENSLGGSIHAVYDLLIQYKLYIVGEVTVAVNHCLLALPGVQKKDIKRVISHWQALAQVDGYTRNMGAVCEAVDDTAGAAQMVAENGWRDTAAVASARAAELHGMQILETGIQDNKKNVTRFLILSRDPRVQSPSSKLLCKTSVVFSLKEGPGELFKACSVFALRRLDMTKIESRPLRLTGSDGTKQSFRYLFYIDFVASMANETGQNALRHLTELATFIRVLGCYPLNMES